MKDLIETHGKTDDEPREKFAPTLLEQVWGADNLSRYGTIDETAYTRRLQNMTRTDLEAHARQMGVVIVEHTPRLYDKLLNEFRSYVALARKPMTAVSNGAGKMSDAAQKVLSEGR